MSNVINILIDIILILILA